ncbi:MAG: DegT/DnrJ/EryC1/StrS family aminotransferase [Gemmatimonadales bacterium]|nr:MAG: DegT/DnrJ/EryC1/StrS family aminotransferase [Gemmatimonadales bacterium]
MTVPLLDLTPQYDAIRSEVDEAIRRVVDSQYFILGPEVEALEREMAEYLGVPHAVGCASGTDALLLPLMALDPRPGDEVIIPAFTFFATAGAVWNAGFTPVFCDIDPVTFNVTAETLEAVWSPRTRAVIPVHLFGQMAPMPEINALARERGAIVIEDAAQAIGARQAVVPPPEHDNGNSWIMAGAAGDAGSFSFFPTKNLGGFGDGGLVSTTDDVMADRVGKLRVHGGRQMYHHEMVGTNSRLDALQAAILRVKLRHLPEWTAARGKNACAYHGSLRDVAEIVLPDALPGNVHVYNQYTIRAQRRDELRAHLSGKGIGSGVYYPVPLHLQECFRELGGKEGQLPETERACREVLSLPIFPELGEERQARVIEEICAFYGRG